MGTSFENSCSRGFPSPLHCNVQEHRVALNHLTPVNGHLLVVLHGKPILERYRCTQPLSTMPFHVLLVSLLYELSVTSVQRVCMQLLSACSQSGWQWQSQSRARQTFWRLWSYGFKASDFVESVGLPLLSTTLRASAFSTSIRSAGAPVPLSADWLRTSNSSKSCRLAIDDVNIPWMEVRRGLCCDMTSKLFSPSELQEAVRGKANCLTVMWFHTSLYVNVHTGNMRWSSQVCWSITPLIIYLF